MSERSKLPRDDERPPREATVRDGEAASGPVIDALSSGTVARVDASAMSAMDDQRGDGGVKRAFGWRTPKRGAKKRPGEVDPDLDERMREKRLGFAKVSLLICGISMISALAEISAGPLRFGGGLSVAAAWAFAALLSADGAERHVPRWQRVAVYGLTAVATVVVLAGIVGKMGR